MVREVEVERVVIVVEDVKDVVVVVGIEVVVVSDIVTIESVKLI